MPPINFVNMCKAAKIALPAAGARPTFLTDAGAIPSVAIARDAERCAALAWARDSLNNNVDPESWPTTLDAALTNTLMSLYALPPYKGPLPIPSNARRLADVIILYMPGAAPPDNAPPPPQPDGININRGAGAPPMPVQGPPPPPANAGGTGAPHGSADSSPPPKRKWLMHADLSRLLPPDVYHALDSSAGMETSKRAKLQESCLKHDLSMVLDCTTSAAFSHQMALALSDRAHFDPLARGLAFACAGRSAPASADESHNLADSINQDAFLGSMRNHWNAMTAAFASDTELSSSHTNNLWAGPTFIMRLRAARSATWGVPEVEASCRAQLLALPAYRSAIATAITRVASTFVGAAAARSVNKAYLTFFSPFWSEHLLERGRLSREETEKFVKGLLDAPAPALAPAPPPVQPLPTPPPAPPPAQWPPTPPPVPVYYPPALPHGYYGTPPAAPTPPPAYRPPAPTPGANLPVFVGKPTSPVIIGNNFGLANIPTGRPCPCAVTSAYPTRAHRTFECPLKYWAFRGGCPGWTAAGVRIPSHWNGDDITTACQMEWRTFAANLPSARSMGSFKVKF